VCGGLGSGSQIIGSVVLVPPLAWVLAVYVFIILVAFLSSVCGYQTAQGPRLLIKVCTLITLV